MMQSCGFLLIWSAILKCFKNIAFDWLGVYVPKRHNVQWGTNLHLCISHFPFSQTSRLLVLRHHRQILFTDFYLKPCATTSAIPWTPQSQANSSRRQGHVLNVRPSFQTSLFSPHHHVRVISKSKTCGFVAEASAVKLMVPANSSLNVYQIPHTHPPVFSKMPGASSVPSSSAPSCTRSA